MDIGWSEVFLPDTPALEIMLRGTVMYLALFGMLRALKRQSSDVGIADLLVIVLIADAAQNAMAADYTSLSDGLLLVATIIFWSYALDWLAYHNGMFERLVHPPPLQLVKDGVMIRKNMKKELLTTDELMSQLREQGIEDVKDVRRASVEADGRISVTRMDEGQAQARERRAA